VDEALGRTGREARAGNYFAFTMKVQPDLPNALLLTYIGDDKNRKFDILVDGILLTTVDWKGGKPINFTTSNTRFLPPCSRINRSLPSG
jgi:hypothetical protein